MGVETSSCSSLQGLLLQMERCLRCSESERAERLICAVPEDRWRMDASEAGCLDSQITASQRGGGGGSSPLSQRVLFRKRKKKQVLNGDTHIHPFPPPDTFTWERRVSVVWTCWSYRGGRIRGEAGREGGREGRSWERGGKLIARETSFKSKRSKVGESWKKIYRQDSV